MSWSFGLKALNLGASGECLQLPSVFLSILSDRLSWELGSGQEWYVPQVETRHLTAMLAPSRHCEGTRRLGHVASVGVVASSVYLNTQSAGSPAKELFAFSVCGVTSLTQKEVVRGLQGVQAGVLFKLFDPNTSLNTSASVPSSVKKKSSKTFPLRIVERNMEDQNSYGV